MEDKKLIFKCLKNYIANIVNSFDYNDFSPSADIKYIFMDKLEKLILEKKCFWTEHIPQDSIPGWEFFIEIKSYRNDKRKKTYIGFCCKNAILQIAVFDMFDDIMYADKKRCAENIKLNDIWIEHKKLYDGLYKMLEKAIGHANRENPNEDTLAHSRNEGIVGLQNQI